MNVAFNFRNGVLKKLFTISKINVAKYNENTLIWCFYMVHLDNKREHSVKA